MSDIEKSSIGWFHPLRHEKTSRILEQCQKKLDKLKKQPQKDSDLIKKMQAQLKYMSEGWEKDRTMLKDIVKAYKDGNYLGYELGVTMVQAKKYLEEYK